MTSRFCSRLISNAQGAMARRATPRRRESDHLFRYDGEVRHELVQGVRHDQRRQPHHVCRSALPRIWSTAYWNVVVSPSKPLGTPDTYAARNLVMVPAGVLR